MKPRTLKIATVAVAVAVIAAATFDQATARRGGLICGLVQMNHYGIRDQNFRLAKHWGVFPHTSAHAGAVVIQSRRGKDSAGNPGGHVSRIVEMRGQCRALVADSRGTYERDICSRLIAYVDPNGNAVSRTRVASAERRTFSAKSHQRHRRTVVAKAFEPVDRLMIH